MSYSDMIIGRRYQKKGALPRRITIKCISALILFIGIYYTFLATRNSIVSIFTVRSVEIVGLDRIRREEIINLSGLGSETNLLLVDLDKIYRRIKGNPWVKDILIRKEFPMRIIIELAERRPEARVATKNGIYLVDNQGMVLEKSDWIYDSLPLINGMDQVKINPGERIEWESAREGLEIIKFLSSHINSNTHNNLVVDVSRRGDLKIHLQDYTLRFGTGSTEEKMDRFLGVKEDLKSRFIEPIEIDLRFPRRVVIKPQAKGEGEIG